MKLRSCIVLTFVAASLLWITGGSVKAAGIEELRTLIDSARVLEANVFTPKVWEKLQRSQADAEQSIRLQKNQKTINQYIDQAMEYVENAIKQSGIAKRTLEQYLPARERAKAAKAPILVSALYAEAEVQFMKATEQVESGSTKDGLKEAAKSEGMFDNVELEAIRADILGEADRLIAKAIADEAMKYALSTLDRAKSARMDADAVILGDRYARDKASILAGTAAYEARHASNISQYVRSLDRNDQAWEKLMLLYEIQMERVGKTIGAERLPFDDGPLAAADTLIAYIGNLQSQQRSTSTNLDTLKTGLADQLKSSLGRMGVTAVGDDPVKLAGELDSRLAALIADKTELEGKLTGVEQELTSLEAQHEEISGELSGRMEREEKFKKAKTILNPSEGEVLFNSSNDIVLRLSGLSFDVSKSEIKDEHIPLLEKVKETIQLFPDANYVVEGHTDTQGEAAANVTLSEKRAFEVMQYLRQALLIPANRIQSMGFGSDHPVASNQTPEGRAKNRRIDIIIMQ